MSDETLNFLNGILSAGLVGFVFTFILKNWKTVEKTGQQMFSKPPVPIFQGVPAPFGVSGKFVGTAPNQSPIGVFRSGCVTIFISIVVIVGLVSLLLAVLGFAPLGNLPVGFMEGVFYAGIIGFFMSRIRETLKVITMAYKKIVSPPAPAMNNFNPPNSFRMAANPSEPAFTVLTQNTGTLLLYSAWLIILSVTFVAVLITAFQILMVPNPLFVPTYTPSGIEYDLYGL